MMNWCAGKLGPWLVWNMRSGECVLLGHLEVGLYLQSGPRKPNCSLARGSPSRPDCIQRQ